VILRITDATANAVAWAAAFVANSNWRLMHSFERDADLVGK
jgi:hypothetical protein